MGPAGPLQPHGIEEREDAERTQRPPGASRDGPAGITLAGCFGVWPASADRVRRDCPREYPRTRAIAVRFLSSPALAAQRAKHGIDLSPAQLRLLTDQRDGEACRRLRVAAAAAPGGEPFTYFRAGGFYFLAAVAPPQSEFALLLVVRRDLTLTDAFAM
jgi:hypothetical protein